MRELEVPICSQNSISPDEFFKTHGFKYRNATGEIIFAMVTCWADISFSVLKLT